MSKIPQTSLDDSVDLSKVTVSVKDDNDPLSFNEIPEIDSLCCIFGLNFPDKGISDFQKAFLVLAHLVASCRESVLKGKEIPRTLLWDIDMLNEIIITNELNQLPKDE